MLVLIQLFFICETKYVESLIYKTLVMPLECNAKRFVESQYRFRRNKSPLSLVPNEESNIAA
jgi:hypothetical protein